MKLFKSTEAAPVNPPTDHVVHPEKITASEEENTYRDISASPCDDVQIDKRRGERSFSALKRLKSPLLSSLAQDKLKGLALLTMESELTRSLDFEDVLNEFVNSKSRKRKFLQ